MYIYLCSHIGRNAKIGEGGYAFYTANGGDAASIIEHRRRSLQPQTEQARRQASIRHQTSLESLNSEPQSPYSPYEVPQSSSCAPRQFSVSSDAETSTVSTPPFPPRYCSHPPYSPQPYPSRVSGALSHSSIFPENSSRDRRQLNSVISDSAMVSSAEQAFSPPPPPPPRGSSLMASLGEASARHSMCEDTTASGVYKHGRHSRPSGYEMVRGRSQDTGVRDMSENADYSLLDPQLWPKMRQTSHKIVPVTRAHSDECLELSSVTPVESVGLFDRMPHQSSMSNLLDSVRPTHQPPSVAAIGTYSVLSWNPARDITPYSVVQRKDAERADAVSFSLNPETCGDSTVVSRPLAPLPGSNVSHSVIPVEDNGINTSPGCGDEASKN